MSRHVLAASPSLSSFSSIGTFAYDADRISTVSLYELPGGLLNCLLVIVGHRSAPARCDLPFPRWPQPRRQNPRPTGEAALVYRPWPRPAASSRHRSAIARNSRAFTAIPGLSPSPHHDKHELSCRRSQAHAFRENSCSHLRLMGIWIAWRALGPRSRTRTGRCPDGRVSERHIRKGKSRRN
jgi:hypothetical protein